MELIENYSYFGLFLILLVEEAGIPFPLPGDVFIATASAFPNSNYFLIVGIVVAATLIGSTVLFTLSKQIGNRLLFKYGSNIRIPFLRIQITPEKLKRLENRFKKYGGAAIVIGRLIPGLRIITPIAAGFFDLSYKTFWIYTTIAAFIWANIYFIIGKIFGEILEKFFK